MIVTPVEQGMWGSCETTIAKSGESAQSLSASDADRHVHLVKRTGD
jgi:hypothetical protein